MIKSVTSLCLLTLLLSCGCVSTTGPDHQSTALEPQHARGPWKSSQSSHVRLQSQTLGTLPNSGLQLPVVSPDGKWIVYQDHRADKPPMLRSLFSGRGLAPMSLHIQQVGARARGRMLCESGAAWPSWSSDSKTLLYIAFQQNGRCDVVVYEPQTSMTRRLSVAVNPIIMPALSPSGKHAAVVIFEPESQSARLHVVNLSTGKIEHSCPTGSSGAQQLWPQWTPDGRIIFVLKDDRKSQLVQWRPGESRLHKLVEIQMRPTESGSYQAFAGLGRPLSPDGSHFAYYDTAQDRIVLLRLSDSQRIELPVGTRAGCWFGSERFAAADQKQIRLFSTRATMSALLMRAQGLPRGANFATKELFLCSRAAGGRDFNLVKIKILSVE